MRHSSVVGELNTLAGAEADANAATARARWVRRQLNISRHQIARLAVANYLRRDRQIAPDAVQRAPDRHPDKSAIITYLAKQQGARQRALRRLMRAAEARTGPRGPRSRACAR